MNDELFDFISNEEKVPPQLDKSTRELISTAINFKVTLIKFFISMVVGLLITLFLCPQFGISLSNDHQSFSHFIMELGPTVCGAYCGAVFFAGGSLATSLVLRRNEIWWIHRYRLRLFLPFAALTMWGLMFLSGNSADPHFSSTHYHVSWLISAASTSILFCKLALKIKSTSFSWS